MVRKLDRPGDDVTDVVSAVNKDGRMTMKVLAAVARFERDLLIERTISAATRIGRKQAVIPPAALSEGQGSACTRRSRPARHRSKTL